MSLRTLLVSLLLLLMAAAGYYWSRPPRLSQAPDISMLSVDGKELQLSAYRGRPLLVTFWSITCSSCLKEVPRLIDLYRELAPRGLEIIAVAMAQDPPDQVLAMRKARGIPYPVALDIHAGSAHAFGDVSVTPTSFLIAPDGRIVQRRTGRLDMAGLRREILAMIAQQGSSLVEPAITGP